ncbi:O-antigen ligase family protein [Microbacterium dauci]|uniref:O-antigen ligase family protein n=1 Tax=Microbacterium dauci TaxID=3048008 RepID=A0ABT6ZF07_9MICO|nr:O-antigen ligase family protein [Microbacterium sp. LX3-4]MDJ1114493.1 O-antigen ligase family protein [Microbacterium sp. LX3-4]
MSKLVSAVVAVVAVAGIATAILVGGVTASAGIGALVVLFGLAIFLLAIPVHVLPSLAFVILLVLPDRMLGTSVLAAAPPEVLIMLVWAVRKLFDVGAKNRSMTHGSSRTVVTAVLALTAWIAILYLLNPSPTSIIWSVAFIAVLLIPLLIPDRAAEVATLRRVWPWASAAVALYACVQSAIQFNPIYEPLYELLDYPPVQHWAVYRAEASLGHPLTAGLFFAMSFAFCIGEWMSSGRRIFAVLAVVNGLGVIATVSRGPYIAAGVAVAAVLTVAVVNGRRFSRARVALILAFFAVFAVVALQSDAFIERSTSTDGTGSISSRSDLWTVTVDTANAYGWFGSGAGTSEASSLPFNFKGIPIENSYFQLLISIGIPGVILFGFLIVAIYRSLFKSRDLAVTGALTALLVAIAGYAAIDGARTSLVLLGFVLWMAAYRRGPDSSESTPDLTQTAGAVRSV